MYSSTLSTLFVLVNFVCLLLGCLESIGDSDGLPGEILTTGLIDSDRLEGDKLGDILGLIEGENGELGDELGLKEGDLLGEIEGLLEGLTLGDTERGKVDVEIKGLIFTTGETLVDTEGDLPALLGFDSKRGILWPFLAFATSSGNNFLKDSKRFLAFTLPKTLDSTKVS